MQRKSYQGMDCPIALTLEHVGDWWNILILRDVRLGLRRFDEFQRDLSISPNSLTRRLTSLVESGLLERVPYQDKPVRFDYLPTERGRDFFPVLDALYAYGMKHFPPQTLEKP